MGNSAFFKRPGRPDHEVYCRIDCCIFFEGHQLDDGDYTDCLFWDSEGCRCKEAHEAVLEMS
jgi:hypothetical protein